MNRKLGRSGLEIAPLVFGTNVFGWTVDQPTAFRLLDRFVDSGLKAIDTADVYSRWAPGNQGGESDTMIGNWLKASPARRSQVVLITKVGAAPGLLASAVGLFGTVAVVLAVGAVATNVIGQRLLNRGERWLMMIPVFRTIYAPVKQLVVAFSPDNEQGFKRVVMVEDPHRGWVMGFLTKEFTVDRGAGAEPMMAVYVPTNHLYLGDIVLYPRERALFPDIPVEEGIRIFLTGGMSLPGRIAPRK